MAGRTRQRTLRASEVAPSVGEVATLRPVRGDLGAIFLVLINATAWAEPPPVPLTRPAASATAEAGRLGAEYFVQKNGAVWVYQLDKGKGRVSVNGIAEWRVQYSYSLGKRSGSGAWFAREGVWMERAGGRGEHDAVVLPASMTRGTRWQAPASIERGGGKGAQYEVMALEASVELPSGLTVEHCLAVLETNPDGSDPWTHYYAPNVGKVAVLSPDGWFSRLLEFRAGAGHAE